MYQKTGELRFADHAEKLTYNAMMGFRNEDGSAITYGKGDNCYKLDGHHHGEHEKHEDVRYKYSPTHSDPAVCCAPNFGRNLPYFLDQMWLKDKDGLVATYYGPSVLSSDLGGQKVKITQNTQYPFSDQIEFVLDLDQPSNFPLSFRQPEWAESLDLIHEGATIKKEGSFVKLEKEWHAGDKILLKFVTKAEIKKFSEDNYYIQRGPLLYALPIAHDVAVIKTYEGSNFKDYYCNPTKEDYKLTSLMNKANDIKLVNKLPNDPNSIPWHKEGFYLEVPVYFAKQFDEVEAKFVPLGSTILRRLTFPMQELN